MASRADLRKRNLVLVYGVGLRTRDSEGVSCDCRHKEDTWPLAWEGRRNRSWGRTIVWTRFRWSVGKVPQREPEGIRGSSGEIQ